MKIALIVLVALAVIAVNYYLCKAIINYSDEDTDYFDEQMKKKDGYK